MKELEEILYREDPSDKFKKYIYVGTAYPEDMHNSHPRYKTLKEWQEFVESDDYAEILVNLFFCQNIYSQERESFEDLFGEELYRIFEEINEDIGAAGWFWGTDIPVFQDLIYEIKKSRNPPILRMGNIRRFYSLIDQK